MREKKSSRELRKVINRMIKDLDDIQSDINGEGLDAFEKGNKAYLLIDDVKNWLTDLLGEV